MLIGEQLVRMEHKLDDNLGVLYDLSEIVSDKLNKFARRLIRIEMRLDKTELRALHANKIMTR